MLLLAIAENAEGLISDSMALAALALIGYLVGHRTRNEPSDTVDEKLGLDISRAAMIAKELHQVAQRIRQDVSSHQSKIDQFKDRIGGLQREDAGAGWQRLSDEAENLLAPTMKLATNLSIAYDQLRKQSSQLMNFAETRTDTLTGVCNRRAMEEQLDVLFSLHAQNDGRFSLALFSRGSHADNHPRPEQADDQLRKFADLLAGHSRDSDLVARCSPNEFIVLMPHTSLAGATVYSERIIKQVDAEMGGVTCGGLVEVQSNDTPTKILSRADSALYSARTNSSSCLYLHNGKTIRPHDGPHRTAQQRSQVANFDNGPEEVQPADLPKPALAGSEF